MYSLKIGLIRIVFVHECPTCTMRKKKERNHKSVSNQSNRGQNTSSKYFYSRIDDLSILPVPLSGCKLISCIDQTLDTVRPRETKSFCSCIRLIGASLIRAAISWPSCRISINVLSNLLSSDYCRSFYRSSLAGSIFYHCSIYRSI